ncbi:MAG: undecaprenyldiphospho-muramoylpentapeptide beta-N-acetylglucosaminyltransferase [Cytophagaceae bacterium]|nr:undecaprenyldiphospho-muramoylpentapeptide beta-N-acetylglucosaminyltransferase [Cytophagaceae bacterium]
MTTDKKYKIIISGGGTGGHIFPAIAIANALVETGKIDDILFVGAKGKMEMEKIPQAGYKIIGLPVAGLQRRITVANLTFPFKLLKSVWQARAVVRSFKPDVVIGVGGYASGPTLIAANLARIPTIIQEQNSYAGLTNKWLAASASKICVAYSGMNKYFPEKKIILTGNPVRKNLILSPNLMSDAYKMFNLIQDKQTILVIGGSMGAKTLNETVAAHLDELNKKSIQVLWQTGKSFYSKAKQIVKDQNAEQNISVHEFIKDMASAYAVADVVISRAGALAIAELCVVAKPVILVPSPNVAEDHQTKNALALVKENAAICISDEKAQTELIPAAIRLLEDVEKQHMLKTNIARLAKPNAAADIAKEILRLLEDKSKHL